MSIIFAMGDTPPFDFVGELFAMIDGGTSGEIVCMNPYDGTISVKNLDKYYETSSTISLFELEDYENDATENTEDSEVFIDWVGVEAKLCYGGNKMVVAVRAKEKEERNMDFETSVGSIRNFNNNISSALNWTHLMEVLVWKESNDWNGKKHKPYENKFITRVGGSPYYIDTCGQYDKVYASFSPEDNSARSFLGHTPSASRTQITLGELNESRRILARSNAIYRFPLYPSSYLPSSTSTVGEENRIECGSSVCSFAVDCSGETIVVGTDTGSIEIWDTGLATKKNPSRIKILDLSARHHRQSLPEDASISIEVEPSDGEDNDVIELQENAHLHDTNIPSESRNQISWQTQEETDDVDQPMDYSRMNEEGTESAREASSINQIILTRHLPISSAGFCTLQSGIHRCTLWHVVNRVKPFSFQKIGTLSFPHLKDVQVNFNGKRLILFGKDKVGFVIYVYCLWNSCEDDFDCKSHSYPVNDGLSPKIFDDLKNASETNQNRIIWTNKIRHFGLGGLEAYESLILSSNERYIVVNTKNGALMNENGDGCDGLWVIDLLQTAKPMTNQIVSSFAKRI